MNLISSENQLYQSCHQPPPPLEVQVSCEDPDANQDDKEGDLDSMSDEDGDCIKIQPGGLKLSSQMEYH